MIHTPVIYVEGGTIQVRQVNRKKRVDWRVECTACKPRQRTDYGTRKDAEAAALDHQQLDHPEPADD